jgi:hypothetical protein
MTAAHISDAVREKLDELGPEKKSRVLEVANRKSGLAPIPSAPRTSAAGNGEPQKGSTRE